MSNNLPPAESYPKSEQPLDVVAVGGLIIDGRVHAHIDFSDERNGFGGHLEEGCLALTFIVVAVAVIVRARRGESQRTAPEEVGEPG